MTKSEIKIGLPVIYWGVIKSDGQKFEPMKTEIISESWELPSGEVVCKVKEKSGGVSIKHLDKISPGSILAAQLQECKNITEEDFINESKKFFNSKGVDVNISVKFY